MAIELDTTRFMASRTFARVIDLAHDQLEEGNDNYNQGIVDMCAILLELTAGEEGDLEQLILRPKLNWLITLTFPLDSEAERDVTAKVQDMISQVSWQMGAISIDYEER